MKTLAEQVRSYAAYHGEWRNKIAHFIGVPVVTFSLFLALSWLRFVHDPLLPISAAVLGYVGVVAYYFRLDRQVALLQMPFTLGLLALADRVAVWWPLDDAALLLGATFVGGWGILFVGHVFEGRRPAAADNILQIFNAPLFLTVEVLFMLGCRPDLRAHLEPRAGNIVGAGTR